MSKFRECVACGAALDPGEACDCQMQPEQEEAGQILELTQAPIIYEKLVSVEQNMTAIRQHVFGLPLNEDSLKEVKGLRAKIRKQFDELEDQRKAVKKAVMEPYEEAEKTYKAFVSTPFNTTDGFLKAWIDGYQDNIKIQCENRLKEYFAELCQSFNIDFLRYEDCGVRVDMTLARQKEPRKAMDQIYQFVDRVHTDIETIMLYEPDHAAEVFTAYRNHRFNLGEALAFIDRQKQDNQQAQTKISAMKQTAAVEAEVVKKVEAIAPPVAVAAAPKEPVICCTFKAIGTRTQIKKMKEFAIKEGIRFE